MMKSVWKDIIGYEGMYQVDCSGQVRSVKRVYVDSNGVCRSVRGRILKQSVSNGYGSVTLNNKGKKRFTVHRLVAISFIENPEGKAEVNHKDGVKLNNSVDNLEWVTKSENTIHAYSIGLMKPQNKI